MTIQHINVETGELLTPRQVACIVSRPKRWGRPDRPRHSEHELRHGGYRTFFRHPGVPRAIRQDLGTATAAALTIIVFMLAR